MTLLSLLTCGPGIVHEKLLSDYLYRIFSSPDRAPTATTSRYGWVGRFPHRLGPDQRLRLPCGEGGLGSGRLAWILFSFRHFWL